MFYDCQSEADNKIKWLIEFNDMSIRLGLFYA